LDISEDSCSSSCEQLAATEQCQLKLRIFAAHLQWLQHAGILQGVRIPPWGSSQLSLLSQVAVPDVVEATNGADILVFVLPHQFIGRICDQIAGQIKSGTFGISLIKVSCHLGKTQPVGCKYVASASGQELQRAFRSARVRTDPASAKPFCCSRGHGEERMGQPSWAQGSRLCQPSPAWSGARVGQHRGENGQEGCVSWCCCWGKCWSGYSLDRLLTGESAGSKGLIQACAEAVPDSIKMAQ